jgi:hypothetical protein
MQSSVVPIVGNRLEFIRSFRIYLTDQSEYVDAEGLAAYVVQPLRLLLTA